jgi:hypothetical protein
MCVIHGTFWGGCVKGLLATGDVDVVQPFVQALAASGYVIQ